MEDPVVLDLFLWNDFFCIELNMEKLVTDVAEFPIKNTKLFLSSLMGLHDNYTWIPII